MAFTVSVMLAECVSMPLVPVIVTVAGPVVAVAPAVKVSVLVPVAGLGLNDAVTPAGKVPVLSVTLPVKPLTGVILTVLVPAPPCVTVAFVADRLKSGCPGTVRLIVVVWVRLPLTPVTVTLAVPVVAVADAVKVNVLVPVVGFGANDAVTPDGRPLALRVTLPVKPPDGVTVIPLVAVPPRLTVTAAGEAESEKFAAPGIVRASVAL